MEIKRYRRKVNEVEAVQATRSNTGLLQKFTGGGLFETQRCLNGIATYIFTAKVCGKNVQFNVPENFFIVRYPDGGYHIYSPEAFYEEFIQYGKDECTCCGSCRAFEAEDSEGNGYCAKQDRMRQCSDLACAKWNERQKPYDNFLKSSYL